MMAERWSEVQMAYMRADQKQIQRPLSMSTEYVLSGIFMHGTRAVLRYTETYKTPKAIKRSISNATICFHEN